MLDPARVVEGPYVRDILDQPRALAETHRRLGVSPALDRIARRLANGGYRRVVLTGMGSSYHGFHPLLVRLVEQDVPATLIETSELLHYQSRLVADALLVIASQSGRSAEIVRLLERVQGRADSLAVTNTATSPLGRQSTAALLTHAGEEATVACKTYVAMQLALAWLGAVLSGDDPARAREELASLPEQAAAYLRAWRAHVDSLSSILSGIRSLYFVGRGPSLAAAGSAGLITKEATHRPAEGMSSAAFRHGPMELLDESVFVLAFAGPAATRTLNETLVLDVGAAGGRAHLVSEDAEVAAFRLPPVPEDALPVVELLPVEMVTLALAALDGREAGDFRIGGKVTTTE
jgi:glucosamine--fructose-6-phosphate aminotransferase (isomerizing)